VAPDGRTVYALWAADGTVDWSYTNDRAIVSSPVVADGRVYVAADDVYALDDSTGAVAWTFATGDAVGSTPSTIDGRLVVGSDDGRVYRLDAANGTEVANATTGMVRSKAPVANDVAFVGNWDGTLYALGNVTSSSTTSSADTSDPSVSAPSIDLASGGRDLE
jgi:outer membrane protein assembly factor BamB